MQDNILNLNKLVKQIDLSLINQPSMEIVEEESEQSFESNILDEKSMYSFKSILMNDNSREFDLSTEEDDEFDQVNQRDPIENSKINKILMRQDMTQSKIILK